MEKSTSGKPTKCIMNFKIRQKYTVTKLTYFLKLKSEKRTKNNMKKKTHNKIVLYTREGKNISSDVRYLRKWKHNVHYKTEFWINDTCSINCLRWSIQELLRRYTQEITFFLPNLKEHKQDGYFETWVKLGQARVV